MRRRVERVQGAEGLVQQQHFGPAGERAGERGALRHATGHLARTLTCGVLSSPTSCSSSRTRSRPAAFFVPRGRPSSTFWASVRHGSRRGSWKAIAVRSSVSVTAVIRRRGSVPAVGVSRPPIRRSRVDLPQPDGPMTATISPRCRASRSTPRSTSRGPCAVAKVRPTPSSATARWRGCEGRHAVVGAAVRVRHALIVAKRHASEVGRNFGGGGLVVTEVVACTASAERTMLPRRVAARAGCASMQAMRGVSGEPTTSAAARATSSFTTR